MIDIHIITCQRTATRLPNLLQSLQALLNMGEVQQVRLLCKGDIGYNNEVNYSSKLWSEHISSIYPILAKNIAEANGRQYHRIATLLGQSPDVFFPTRGLRPEEKSLLSKHFESLSLVQRPTLVIEDDAFICPGKERELLAIANEYCHSGMYIDLGMIPGIKADNSYIDTHERVAVTPKPIALTRTTSAFIVDKIAALQLSAGYWPCALPADLHHQYLLFKYKIRGCWPKSIIMINLSTAGIVESSIQ